MDKIALLRKFNIKPIVVFDGGILPMKEGTHSGRSELRKKNFADAMDMYKKGYKEKANELFKRAIKVTPEMAFTLICELKKHGVEYVVAPYEADAQMAYLEKIGYVDAIITDDSDLIMFGCKNVNYFI